MTTPCYIYGLAHPKSGKIRYVGKSANPHERRLAHIHYSRHAHTAKDNWILKLMRNGLLPDVVILERCSEDNWQIYERMHIAMRKDLLNHTPGGDGIRKGSKLSIETRRKMGNSRRGKPSGMLGKKHSEKARLKIGAASSKRIRSEATKQRVRDSMFGKKHSWNTRLKMRKSKKGQKPWLGRKHTKSGRENISKSHNDKRRIVCQVRSAIRSIYPLPRLH